MALIDQIMAQLQQLSPFGVLAVMFLIAYVENIFPPSPSDVLLVFAGTLIGIGTVGFFPSLVSASLGSTLGFLTAYFAGRYFERRIVEGKTSRFLPAEAIAKVESWFQHYGYGVIVANRFLAGTRAVVSFFAGMSRLNLLKTTLLCAISATAWNALLLYGGMMFGSNWRRVTDFLSVYSKLATIVCVVIIAIVLWRVLRRRRNATAS